MAIEIAGHVGPSSVGDGVSIGVRMGRQADLIVSEYHPQFYETNFRGNLYSGGMTTTAINNATFTSATTGATATPIAGLWNPMSSGVNLVMVQAVLGVTLTALTATGGGPFVWMVSTGNSAITTGAAPLNRKTLLTGGSYTKNLCGAACTGMTGALSIIGCSLLAGGAAYNISNISTAAGFMTGFVAYDEIFNGDLIVPPGGVIALMATTTPVAHSASSKLIWEEVPVSI